ncbi:PDGLE domain-containing protein [Thermofilum pendens]|uniref:Cobalamin biosynthesis protein n=1 Tax=Thermofilum pendens (strain DSM 2475 / Hrk 5) TaxID=368408 RepID=A1S105_THEPD|nr:PDGLE domain-containing protein [Thermofilum pendens]ABL79135.1 cobalamin biosynthesis protein [Thermofilum pendens Hrk 5]
MGKVVSILKKHRKAALAVLAMVLVSPVFGVWLANLVGYHEPLDLAAEALGLNETTEEINWTPFLDYTVPGLPDWLGYIVSGFLGVAVVLALGYLLLKALK